MFGANSIREETAGAPTDFRLGKVHALNENEVCAVFPVDADFRGREIRVGGNGGSGNNNRGGRRSGLTPEHVTMTGVEPSHVIKELLA